MKQSLLVPQLGCRESTGCPRGCLRPCQQRAPSGHSVYSVSSWWAKTLLYIFINKQDIFLCLLNTLVKHAHWLPVFLLGEPPHHAGLARILHSTSLPPQENTTDRFFFKKGICEGIQTHLYVSSIPFQYGWPVKGLLGNQVENGWSPCKGKTHL